MPLLDALRSRGPAPRGLPVLLAGALACAACGDAGTPDPAASARQGDLPTVIDLEGERVEASALAGTHGTVFLFVMSDCPVSNRYAPEVARLDAAYASLGIEFVLVYADPVDTPERIREHVTAFAYPCAVVLDPEHALLAHTGATMTPEAAVFAADGTFVYRGRIDDRTVDYGQVRREPTQRDLQDVLDALVAGHAPAFRSTKAVGCFIPELEERG